MSGVRYRSPNTVGAAQEILEEYLEPRPHWTPIYESSAIGWNRATKFGYTEDHARARLTKERLSKDAADPFRLLRAFRSIRDPASRRRVVETVEAMAAGRPDKSDKAYANGAKHTEQ